VADPNVTVAGAAKFVPVNVTVSPIPPLDGLNDVTVGAAANAGTASANEPTNSTTEANARRRNMCAIVGAGNPRHNHAPTGR
jgi:hypothetical protein